MSIEILEPVKHVADVDMYVVRTLLSYLTVFIIWVFAYPVLLWAAWRVIWDSTKVGGHVFANASCLNEGFRTLSNIENNPR